MRGGRGQVGGRVGGGSGWMLMKNCSFWENSKKKWGGRGGGGRVVWGSREWGGGQGGCE